ncbi:hypothetical protein OESDEN_12609, partial [Oesophagostomum dentatum]
LSLQGTSPSTHGSSPSICCGIFWGVVSIFASALVAILFVVAYFMMSEQHREVAVKIHKILGVTNEDLIGEMMDSVLWMIDGAVACICLFLILEDAFLLYELNCEVQYLNSEAYLSLLEALEVDNRYIKDAIILEAAEQEERDRAAMQHRKEALTPVTPVTPLTPSTPLTPLTSTTPMRTAPTPEMEEGSL